MCVGQDHRIDLGNGHRQHSVLLFRVYSLPLEHPAVEKHCLTIYAQNMTGARHFTGCAIKLNFQCLRLSDCAALEQDYQTLFILRHEGWLPASSAPLIEKVSQRIFILTCVPGKLHHYCLIFLHAEMK